MPWEGETPGADVCSHRLTSDPCVASLDVSIVEVGRKTSLFKSCSKRI